MECVFAAVFRLRGVFVLLATAETAKEEECVSDEAPARSEPEEEYEDDAVLEAKAEGNERPLVK